jgi:hypothetical protein
MPFERVLTNYSPSGVRYGGNAPPDPSPFPVPRPTGRLINPVIHRRIDQLSTIARSNAEIQHNSLYNLCITTK